MDNATYLDNYGDVLIPKDLMAILHIGRNRVYKLLEEGQIKSVKVGCTYRIPKIYLMNYLYPDYMSNNEMEG